MWLELFAEIIAMMLEKCPKQERNRANVNRLVSNPTRQERRQFRFAFRRESDRMVAAYLGQDDDDRLGAFDQQGMAEDICKRLGIVD